MLPGSTDSVTSSHGVGAASVGDRHGVDVDARQGPIHRRVTLTEPPRDADGTDAVAGPVIERSGKRE